LQESVDKAREAFRAAREGRELLAPREPAGPAERPAPREADGIGEWRVPQAIHPFFRGLLDTLPEPGADWPRAQREQWLETARNIFALIYKDPGEEREHFRLSEAQQHTPRTELDQRSA
jgi:hypothetical protein